MERRWEIKVNKGKSILTELMSCISTVIQNYFKISNASYTPSIIPYEFIYNLCATRKPSLENLIKASWKHLAILVDALASTSVI